ncbi:LPXTG cell wall anchor domain-containing protein [Pediococcus ethanolidurans]|uniref:SpaA isopeptide-forming pilin-related protein n=1 Tax=Pediococcus ethanolidurans TaxID=319653 RepID=UPI002952DDCC|nr:SpaA isopeptide-forming pilin-related protein [Pediococcus ethanolidurans]MDV7718526.1 LPXTG cell wall anchor domain-containing protein [Pediococcus ethanolidurans]
MNFTVFQKEVTIKEGKASVDQLPLDDYYWIETKAPKGYLLDTEKHTFKLEYAGQDKQTTTHTETVKEQVIKGEFDLVKVAGDQSEGSRLVNVDEAAKSKHALKDVEFTVTSDTTKKVVKTSKTDDKGYLYFTDLSYDTYTITETKAPDGYTAVKPFKVTIKEQGQFFHYKVENKQPETPEALSTPSTPDTPKASNVVSAITSKLPQTGEKSALWLSIIGGILLLDGEIIFKHCLIIKNVQLIQGHYRLFLKFPNNEYGRLALPLNKNFYSELLQQITEYYYQLRPDS